MPERSDNVRATPALAAIYGAIHALIDLTTVSVIFRTIAVHQLAPQHAFAIVLGYDLIAFGTQFVLGLVADRFRAARAAVLCGIALSGCAILALPVHELGAMTLAGIGNALFHLGAGALVLHLHPCRAAPSGVFVAPGALGLGLGLYLGKHDSLGPLWPLLIALALSLLLAAFVRNPVAPAAPASAPSSASPSLRLPVVVGLLMLSVAVRSAVGMGASFQCPPSSALLLGIPLAAFAGKSLGGFLSDRLGWSRTSVGALLLSAPLIALGGSQIWLLLPGLVLFQMTMPVTLAATALAMPRRAATAFGLTTLALVLGALPTFFDWGKAWYGSTTFVVLIVISAASVYAALRWLGGPQGSQRQASVPGLDASGSESLRAA